MTGFNLLQLFDDVRYWIDNQVYNIDEITIRFHHKLVFTHPYPNGNGRHSRLMADILINKLGGSAFSWGQVSLVTKSKTRDDYIAALQAADNHNMLPLLAFARS